MRGRSIAHPHFSVSRLQALRLCPFRHHLQYDLGIRVGGPASRRGIALHEAVSGLLLRWGETSPEEEVEKVASRRCLKAEEGADVMELMGKFEILLAPRIKGVVAVEEPVEVRVGHIRVVGRVDAVVETEEGLELWEFKTGRANGHLDPFPLGVYALGIKEIIGRVPGRWAYVKLQQAEARLYMGGEEMAEAVRAEVEKVVEQLRDIKEPQPHPGLWCRGCPYVRWCPGKREKPLALPSHQGWLWSTPEISVP